MTQDFRFCRTLPLWSLLLGTLIAISSTLALANGNENLLRDRFLEAEKALKKSHLRRYTELYEQLEDYPLRPYLELEYLKKKLHRAEHDEIREFLQRYKGDPVADLLRRKWLDQLAKKKSWNDLLAFYTPQTSTRRQCHHLRAMVETGSEKQAWPLVEKIWLHGKSRPKACDPVFSAWEAAGGRSKELTWKRIALAMEAGEWQLARYLGKKLGKQERTWVERWTKLYRNPKLALELNLSSPHPYRETMLGQAVRRLASRDAIGGLELWNELEKRFDFPAALAAKTKRRVALALERKQSPSAYAFINGLQPEKDDTRLHTARFRAALLRQDWELILERLEEWPASDRNERWQYWRARALSALGQPQEAKSLFREAADNRSYYGFLAADQVSLPYHLDHQDTPKDPAVRGRLEQMPGIIRSLELHALNRDVEARREWRYATRDLSKPELKAAAIIAQNSGWLDQAIFTLAKTGYWDDLKLRFPLKYRDLVASEAQSHTLDTAWVYAVIRQESAFMRDAHSHAGALGLMQLMPATARSVAVNQLKRKPPGKYQLLKPATNIALGSAYLGQLKEKLNQNPVLATAAYNAGPHRVARWLPKEDLPADIWVELVPFRETQRYLKRVMSYMVIYDKRLGKEPKRLKERMVPVLALKSGARVAGG